MDQQQMQSVNRAAEQWILLVQRSFRTLADSTVALQESNLRLTQSFFQQFVEQLQSQTQDSEQATRTLQQQAFETLAQESVDAYSDFLNSAVFVYQERLQHAVQATEDASQALQSNVQAARQGTEAANRAARETAGRDEEAGEGRLALLERTGEVKIGSGRLPADFWDLPRPEDPEGLVRSAVQEDRR